MDEFYNNIRETQYLKNEVEKLKLEVEELKKKLEKKQCNCIFSTCSNCQNINLKNKINVIYDINTVKSNSSNNLFSDSNDQLLTNSVLFDDGCDL